MPSKNTLTEQVYERVYEDVVNGVFVNGQVITENMLIQRYHVSKSPVREALVSLCDEQVLQSIPRTGYQ
ncbi:GntR family transcriptional regulator, partial [Allofournierella sp.]